jgi:glycosyltransferase involved in cell wall biosynthesis
VILLEFIAIYVNIMAQMTNKINQEVNHFDSSNYEQKGPKKRILFVITQSEYGGAQKFLFTLATHLNANKYDIAVAAGPSLNKDLRIMPVRQSLGACGSYELLDDLKKENIKIIKLLHLRRNISVKHDFLALFELKKVIKTFKPDTLFLSSSKAGFLGSFVAKFIIYKSSFKILYRIGGWTFNDPWPEWKRKFWISLERISSKWKDFIILNNQHDLDQATRLKIKPRAGFLLAHNGIDIYKMNFYSKEEARLKLFEKLSKQSGKIFQVKKIIGTIANFYPTKGLEYLIEAANEFKDREDMVFFVIGDGPEREKLELGIKNNELGKRIFLLGQLADAHKYLPAFDAFVLPSIKEGSPWSLIEAMAAKLPVISTNVGAVPEIIEDGKNGYIVEPKHPEQIVEKLREILENDRLKQELGIQAHQTVLFKFSLDKMVTQIEDLF